jgi:hypothetical protein
MSENENDFEALRRLLALKRHEIPPPGYFENFSSQVIGRIRASEVAQELPLLLRFLQWIERRPAFPVAFASSLCLFLLYGIVSVQQNPEMAPVFGAAQTPSVLPVATVSSASPNTDQPSIMQVDTNSPVNESDNDSTFINSTPGPLYRVQPAGLSQ